MHRRLIRKGLAPLWRPWPGCRGRCSAPVRSFRASSPPQWRAEEGAVELVRTPVHRALTRPQMFAGVTYSFFVINMALTTEAFLITGSFLALPIALVIHGVGYLA